MVGSVILHVEEIVMGEGDESWEHLERSSKVGPFAEGLLVSLDWQYRLLFFKYKCVIAKN